MPYRMPFISFFYKIGNHPKMYYGKYFARYISDDHEGLDEEVRPLLEHSIEIYRKTKNLPPLRTKIHIGVLSLCRDDAIPTFSSKREFQCFDFYHDYDETYINGKLMPAQMV